MKIVNILLNYKKANHNNQVLGVEKCFLDYSKNLANRGIDIVSVIKSKIFLLPELKKINAKILELPALNQGDIYSILKLAWKFLFFKPDIIICHSGRALMFSRIARLLVFRKIPIAVIDHGINPLKFVKADFVLTVNSFFSKQLIQAGMPENRCMVIPNMIEIPENFQPLIKSPITKKIRLGSLGRLSSEKNFDKVIKAMPFLLNQGFEVEYVIGGVGIESENLYLTAKNLGIEKNFKILGWVEDKRKFFSEIDIFILPSFGETFGIVLLEAMLYNTPIISSNSWGPDEIVSHQVNGLKISKDDSDIMPELIAKQVISLQQNPELVATITKNAYEDLIKKYTSDVVSEKLIEICNKIINSFDDIQERPHSSPLNY